MRTENDRQSLQVACAPLENSRCGLIRGTDSVLDVGARAELRRRAVILVPVDFSPASVAAAKLGMRLARECQGRLVLFHAVHLSLTPYGPANPAWLKGALCQEAMANAEPLMLAAQEMGVGAVCVVEEGAPAAAIAKTARRWEADAIILPAPPRGFFGRLFGGDTVEKVIRQAPCPVLILQTGHQKTLI